MFHLTLPTTISVEKIMKYYHPQSHFTLTISPSNLENRRAQHAQTFANRGQEIPTYVAQINGENQLLAAPFFFENSRYEFEWIFHQPVKNVRLEHKLTAVNEVFNFYQYADTQTFRGTIDTGNDIGWFHLPLSYELEGVMHQFEYAVEVLPSKMDLHSDLPAMYQDIDEIYPLWRFNLAEKTEQSMQDRRERVDFSLLWLAQFQRLQADFAKALNVVANSPHNRLQAVEKQQKAAKIKGKLPERTAMKIRNDMANGLYHKSYPLTERRLSVDTPENRFVKMTVERSIQILSLFDRTLRKENVKTNRLSKAFFERLSGWQKPLKQIKHQSFMQQVGAFQGLMKESLVLQQRSGYSRVFQIWQELKHYLDCFEQNQAEISQKSVEEIYEVWCFLKLRQILLNLGFQEKSAEKTELLNNEDFSLRMKDGIRGAFRFEKNGVKIRLAHEPRFSKENQILKSFITTQKPDIYLEIEFPNKLRYIWLFDAKYRIKTEQDWDENEDIEHIDYVPDDAINQMHRYRDALILMNEKDLNPKSRPVFGAFALYPGFFDQQAVKNPYQNAIEQIGIGAFALLPMENGAYWLTEFLRKKLSLNDPQHQLLLEHEARISDHGMQQRLYQNLVLMMSLGEKRSDEYLAQFKQGKLKWYHTPVATFSLKMPDYLASEIQFLALAYQGEIERIYPVKSVRKLPRSKISTEQAGAKSQSEELYYLFELSKPLWLEQVISGVPRLNEKGEGFRNSIKLTTLEKLDEVTSFEQIEAVMF